MLRLWLRSLAPVLVTNGARAAPGLRSHPQARGLTSPGLPPLTPPGPQPLTPPGPQPLTPPGPQPLTPPGPQPLTPPGPQPLTPPGLQPLTGSSQSQDTGFIYKPVFTIDYLVALLRQENAKDICVIKVPEEIKYTDYFIIVSGTSARHLHAMAHYALKVYKQIKTEHVPQVNMEGKDTEDWKCIDFGNIVIHFMLPETREVYELEKLWTLRSHDDQLTKIPPEIFPSDFIYEPTDVAQKEQSLSGPVLAESTCETDSNTRTWF